jgi:hypothetical protein
MHHAMPGMEYSSTHSWPRHYIEMIERYTPARCTPQGKSPGTQRTLCGPGTIMKTIDTKQIFYPCWIPNHGRQARILVAKVSGTPESILV